LSPEYANKAGTSLALWRGALDPALAISVILYMENKGKVAFIVPHLAVLEFQISPVCGKLMVPYGLAGLLAPWLTGILYVATGRYAVACLGGADRFHDDAASASISLITQPPLTRCGV
jgi:hypothetical protein